MEWHIGSFANCVCIKQKKNASKVTTIAHLEIGRHYYFRKKIFISTKGWGKSIIKDRECVIAETNPSQFHHPIAGLEGSTNIRKVKR